jgi:TnpA family transposase
VAVRWPVPPACASRCRSAPSTGANPKYFHDGAGAAYFHFTSDQFSGLHYLVIPGTLKDGPYLPAGLLKQQTSLQRREIITDNASYADRIFGLFRLLGYQFSPRRADAGAARLWRLDPKADYESLQQCSRHRINIRLIAHHWDDQLRVAGSLKMHTVGWDGRLVHPRAIMLLDHGYDGAHYGAH